MNRGRPTYGQWGMSCSRHFRILAEEAARRAASDLQNSSFGKETGRDGVQMTFTPHAAEALVLSGMALEAGINEIAVFLDKFSAMPRTLSTQYPDFFNLPVVEKWDTISRWQTGSAFPRGNRLWQDFVSLVDLRNKFVHFTWNPEVPAPPSMQHLVSRDLALPPNPAVSWWDAAMTNRVAAWANRVIDEMFAELIRLLGNQNVESWT